VSFPSSIPFAPFAMTSRLAMVEDVPIDTLPSAAMTNGVTSGFVLSSTTNALPVPVCVILNMSCVEEPDASINGTVVVFAVTLSVFPSNVRLLSTVAFGAEPFSVITPLSVVPLRVSVPDVPDEPLEPDVPEDPEEPVVPLEPVEPEVPAEPEEPVDPDDPEVPLEPLVPDEPELPEVPEEPVDPLEPEEPVDPLEPEVPDDPVDPLLPDEPDVPEEPEVPVEPLDPELPVEPEVPDVPEEPDDPVEPELPEDPLLPVEPELPLEPEEPTGPETLKLTKHKSLFVKLASAITLLIVIVHQPVLSVVALNSYV
jgi:hypothetical protein